MATVPRRPVPRRPYARRIRLAQARQTVPTSGGAGRLLGAHPGPLWDVSHRWFDIQPNAANRRSLLWILCRSHATAAGPVRTLSDTGHSRATELDTGGLCSLPLWRTAHVQSFLGHGRRVLQFELRRFLGGNRNALMAGTSLPF